MKNVLFISAHPDDHITSAGFLLKLKEKGCQLDEIVLTSGTGGYKHAKEKNTIAIVREQEFKRAEKLLGMKKTYLLKYDEHELAMNRENVEAVVKIARSCKPEIIIMPNHDDYHETHIETNRIATKAIRTAIKKRKMELGQPISPAIVLEWEYSILKQPDIIIDITSKWPLKEKLLGCYPSQITPTEKQKLKSLNMYRGAHIGVAYAEGFSINRFLPLRLDTALKLKS